MSRPNLLKAVQSRIGKQPLLILGSGFIFTVFMLFLFALNPAFLQFLDHKVYDTMLRLNRQPTDTDAVCIVDINEKSLNELGQWPWPRYRIAKLLEKIKNAGAKSIAMDMIFIDPDRTSLGILKDEILRDLNIDLDLSNVPPILFDNDVTLAKVLSTGSIILSYKFIFEENQNATHIADLHPINVIVKKTPVSPSPSQILFNGIGVLSNQSLLSSAATASGFVNAISDIDGVVRRVPLMIHSQGKFYPSLALAAFIQATGKQQPVLSISRNGIESIRVGSTIIPTDQEGNLLVHYQGKRGTFDYISAADILKSRIPSERLADKIVLMGASAEGLADIRVSPFDRFFPGVEIHATIIDNLLQKDFISIPGWVASWEFSLVFISGIAAVLLLAWTRAIWCAVILGVCVFSIWMGSNWQFKTQQIYVSPLFPLLTLAGNFTILTLLKFWYEERKVKARNEELAVTQQATIQSLTSLAETRDNDTGGHIRRTQRYVQVLANELKAHPKYRVFLDDETIDLIVLSAPLHDAGKVGIPDNILLKPGKLSVDEFERMKKHTILGRDAIAVAEEHLGSRSFLRFAREIAYSHQEKWDGSGYPEGLKGDDIPVSGRIMAIADVYDALISRRVYKKPFPHYVAVNAIAMAKGSHFDPDMITAFLKVADEFREIALELADTEEQRQILLQTEGV